MDNTLINALFVCDSSSEGHAVFTADGNSVEVRGPVADLAIKGEQYQITIVYVGDKPPHP